MSWGLHRFRAESRSVTTISALEEILRLANEGTSTSSGVHVTHEKALTIAAYHRCIDIRANVLLRMGAPKVQRRGAKGWVDEPAHPVTMALRSIPGMPAEFFYQTRAAHRLSHGRGAAYIDRVGGTAARMIPIDPTCLTPFRENGQDGFLYVPFGTVGQGRKIPATDIWNFIALGWDGVTGYSALRDSRENLGAALAMRQHGTSLFRNGTRPGLLIEVPAAMGDTQEKAFLAQFNQATAGVDNAFKNILLAAGMKVASAPTVMSAEDAQLMEAQAFQTRAVCTRFGVPAQWCNDTATKTYASAEQDAQAFLENTADPDIRSCEASLEYVLLTEDEKRSGDVRIRFDRTPLGMADVKSQAEADKAALAGVPWQTQNEVRDRRGLGPIEGGDKIIIPINLVQAVKPGSPADPTVDPAAPPVDPPADPAAVARAVLDGVAAARSRMLHRLTADARRAGKVPAKFTDWLDGARDAHEGVVREAFAWADGVHDTKGEVDRLFGELRAACDGAQSVKASEFPAALEAALTALEKSR